MRTRSIDNQTQATREARNLLSSFEANPTHLAVQLRIAEALERIADVMEKGLAPPASPRFPIHGRDD